MSHGGRPADILFGIEESLPKKFWEQRYNAIIRQEQAVFFQEHPASFIGLEFPFKLSNANDPRDKLDVI
jgi:hypothetical protein